MKQNIPPAKRYIIICPPRKSSIIKALRQLKGKSYRWIYLGENSSRALAIEHYFGSGNQRLEIGNKLQETARSLRQAYIDYIGKLSIVNNSLEWWANSFSDKNLWFSKTFLYTCYMSLCRELVNSGEKENLLLLGENRTIRQGILANLLASSEHEILDIETPVQEKLHTIINNVKSIINKVKHLAVTIYHMSLARRYRLPPPGSQTSNGEGITLIHNWVYDYSFDDSGKYHDTYLGQLADYLKNKGKRVVISPYLLYATSYRRTLKKLKKNLDYFLLPEAYLKFSDALRTFFKTLSYQDKRIYPDFQDIKIAAIVSGDMKQYLEKTDMTHNLLFYEAIKRWKQAGITIESFIYPYENQTWEKVFCLALRKYYPSTKITGYQHATVPKMLLNYFFSRDELPVLPFPDKVITTGKYTERLFREAGYDPAKVDCGGAIRYASLTQKKDVLPKRDISHPVILVALSMDENETVELTSKVTKAFRDTKQYRIIFKFHPDFPYRFVKRKMGDLPQQFEVSEQPINKLLQDSNLMIYSSTATSIEAIALGVPVLHINSDFTIDRDNLADSPPGVRESAGTPSDILKAAEKILKMDEKELSRRRQLWAEVVADMFGPVDENTFDLFV